MSFSDSSAEWFFLHHSTPKEDTFNRFVTHQFNISGGIKVNPVNPEISLLNCTATSPSISHIVNSVELFWWGYFGFQNCFSLPVSFTSTFRGFSCCKSTMVAKMFDCNLIATQGTGWTRWNCRRLWAIRVPGTSTGSGTLMPWTGTSEPDSEKSSATVRASWIHRFLFISLGLIQK